MSTNNETAMTWSRAGYNVIPAKQDETKAPLGLWTDQYKNGANATNVDYWFGDQAVERICWGILMGQHSRGLVMFEIEGRGVLEGWMPLLIAAVRNAGLGELWDRICSGYMERTPSGGVHWYMRVVDDAGGYGDVAHLNGAKLASRPTTKEERALPGKEQEKRLVVIECKTHGGFSVMAPSGGPGAHKSGGYWTVMVGNVTTVPTVTVAEFEALCATARTLDRMPMYVPRAPGAARLGVVEGSGMAVAVAGEAVADSPFDDLAARTSTQELLEAEGWREVRGRGAGTWMLRPGKDMHGNGGDKGWNHSAVIGGEKGPHLWVWSTSTDLPTEVAIPLELLWAILNGVVDGAPLEGKSWDAIQEMVDWSGIARELARAGYGRRRAGCQGCGNPFCRGEGCTGPGDREALKAMRELEDAREAKREAWLDAIRTPACAGTMFAMIRVARADESDRFRAMISLVRAAYESGHRGVPGAVAQLGERDLALHVMEWCWGKGIKPTGRRCSCPRD